MTAFGDMAQFGMICVPLAVNTPRAVLSMSTSCNSPYGSSKCEQSGILFVIHSGTVQAGAGRQTIGAPWYQLTIGAAGLRWLPLH
jgi:hypothetical protein